MSDTREEIRAAIKQLHEAGKKVGPKAVRDITGRGSYETISKEIDAWKAAQGARPDHTAERVRDLGFELVQMGTAAAQLHRDHREHAPAIALASASLDFMQKQHQETMPFLLQMLQASMASHEALQLEFNAVNAENRRLQVEVSRLNEQLVSLTLDSKKKLDALLGGFDGMQKRLMLSVDQTRQQVAEPLRALREQVTILQTQLNSKTQAFNEQSRTLATQAEIIRDMERRLAEHEGQESI